jgi:hypothetical protein
VKRGPLTWDGGTAVVRRVWSVRGARARLIAALGPAVIPDVHPLITATRVLGLSGDGRSVDFLVFEGVPVGPLVIPNQYRARATVAADEGEVTMEAWAALGIHIAHRLVFTEAEGRVDVDHEVRVWAPWGLRSFVVSTTLAAHDAWAEAVIAWVEAEAAGG